MALQGQGNNSKQKASTNTRGFQFTNSTPQALAKSAMGFNYWNDMVSIQLNPALPEEKQTDFRRFDYDQSIMCSLTLDRCETLSVIIEKFVLPAVEKNEEVSYGIPVSNSSNSLFIIRTVKGPDGDVVPQVGILKDLDAETKKPAQSLYYQFNNSQVVENYNEENGTFNMSQIIPEGMTELGMFGAMLHHAVLELSNASVHAMRNVQRSFHDQIREALNIGNNLGGGNRGGGGSNIFNQGSTKNNQSSGGADETQISDPSALQGMMGM